MGHYEIRGRYAIVTGAGSGINLAFTSLLLKSGCSVVLADLALTKEAQALVAAHPHPAPEPGQPSALFKKTDVTDWAQLTDLWETAQSLFPRIELVVNGAGIYEPPSSTFWNRPSSKSTKDDPAQKLGVYHTFAVNLMAPIRLAQIAIDYWIQNREVEGNLLWIASLAGYVHSMHTPLYFSSKAAIISMARSLGPLRRLFGIRNAAICPGLAHTPIFEQDWCRDRLRQDDLALTTQQCAAIMMRIVTQPEYGDGNIVETMAVGTKDHPLVNVREVPMEALYPTVGPAAGHDNHLAEEETRFMKHLQEHGMQEPYIPESARRNTQGT